MGWQKEVETLWQQLLCQQQQHPASMQRNIRLETV